MSTAGARLVLDSGLTGVTASVHLQAMGVGTTAASRLVAYSRLATATAAVHLFTDRAGSLALPFIRRMGRR